MAAEEEQALVPVCGHKAHRRFREQAKGALTPCCKPPEHKGNHVYCLRVNAGIDDRNHALHFHEEIRRETLKPIMVMDMDGQQLTPENDCAALFQFMEAIKKPKRKRRRKND